jgi:hypothetical protein
MDDELKRWAAAWKSMEVKEMNMMKHAQTAHRHEALTRGAMAAALTVGSVSVVMKISKQVSEGLLPERWPEHLIGGATLVLGALVMQRWGRQIAAARARLEQTPEGMVTDLIRLRERELEWWVGRRAVIMGVVLAVAGFVLALQHLIRTQAAGEPTGFAWFKLEFLVVYLLGLAGFGIRRVRYLRRDLVGLHEVRGELEIDR